MKDFKLAPLALAVCAALSLAACGGGGGNGGDDGTDGGTGGGNGGGTGGGSGSNVVSPSTGTIDLSQATGNLALSSPDAAAKAGVAALAASANAVDASNPSTGVAAKAVPAKAATACADGGTRDIALNGMSTTITYVNCVENDLKQNGKLATSIISASTSGSAGSYSFGETGAPYLSEILNPADERFRSLLEGTGTFDVALGANFAPTNASYTYRLKGAAINLAHPATPRADFELGTAGTAFAGSADFGATQTELTFSGPYKVASYCGSGSGTISTPTPITVDNESGAIVAGQIEITSGSATATYTYNDDETVTITAGGSSKTYTVDELDALCPL